LSICSRSSCFNVVSGSASRSASRTRALWGTGAGVNVLASVETAHFPEREMADRKSSECTLFVFVMLRLDRTLELTNSLGLVNPNRMDAVSLCARYPPKERDLVRHWPLFIEVIQGACHTGVKSMRKGSELQPT
jgi:hypothetical protein